MDLDFLIAFVIGLGAALATEYLPIHQLRHTPRDEWPEWVSTSSYWGLTAVGCVIGGLVSGLYTTGTTQVTWYLAANVGAMWPIFLNGFAQGKQPLTPDPDQVS